MGARVCCAEFNMGILNAANLTMVRTVEALLRYGRVPIVAGADNQLAIVVAPREERWQESFIFKLCNSLPRLCLEGSYSVRLKGPGSATRPGRFPRSPPCGSPSGAPLA